MAAIAAFALPGGAGAATYRVVHDFTRHFVNGMRDGTTPEAGLIIDNDGNLYGTTSDGGGHLNYVHGIVFRLAPDGTETVLHAFNSKHEGTFPGAPLVADGAGNLYGTTTDGGGGNGCDGGGCGTVFKLAPDGTESVLHVFRGGHDGADSVAGLVLDAQGNLYGTAAEDGGRRCSGLGCGIVFRIAPDGTETVLHTFKGGRDGETPLSTLIFDAAGNLYGTTEYGGGGTCFGQRCGTVFKVSPDGTERVLHAFTGGSDGATPFGRLLLDKAGNLYGTTYSGGGSGCAGLGCGTIFKLAPDGTETVLHAFASGRDGQNPGGGLIADAAGNLYGTTLLGGGGCFASVCGTVYRYAPDGTETVLHAFKGRGDGKIPRGELVFDKAGNLYGTTSEGGESCQRTGCGVVFEITP
jgi:uncharacterized repeat protein (TIGR03803 family)